MSLRDVAARVFLSNLAGVKRSGAIHIQVPAPELTKTSRGFLLVEKLKSTQVAVSVCKPSYVCRAVSENCFESSILQNELGALSRWRRSEHFPDNVSESGSAIMKDAVCPPFSNPRVLYGDESPMTETVQSNQNVVKLTFRSMSPLWRLSVMNRPVRSYLPWALKEDMSQYARGASTGLRCIASLSRQRPQ
jgi:hypothetical protein